MHKTRSELWGDPISDPILSSIERFHKAASLYSDNIALICAHQDADLYGITSVPYWNQEYEMLEKASYLRWTYKSLQAGVDRLTVGLRAQGVRPGTAIITLLPNCAEFCLTWWAAMQLGAVMAPLDPRRLSNHDEVSHMLQTIVGEADTQPPVLIAWHQQYLDATAIQSMHTTAKVVVQPLDVPITSRVTSFGQLMDLTADDNGSNGTFRKDSADTSDGSYRDCSIVFTSGSTSLPKGVRRCYPLQTIATSATFDDPGFETLPGDLWCAVAPNNHTVGTATMISPMAMGAGVVYAGASFSAESTADILERERCSHILLIPTMVKMIADVMRDRGQGHTHLKALMIAASPPTADTLHDAFEVLGTRGVCVRYGSTEGIACTSKIVQTAEEMLGKDGQISVGGPARGTGVKICDPESTARDKFPLPRGVAGEIHFSAPFSLPSLYIGQEDNEQTCYVDKEGKRWFVTGDQGVIDDEGRLFVVGRYKDLIIRGGENISPLAMELCLASNSKLGSNVMQVVGQPDEMAGEAPVVIVGGESDTRTLENEIRQTIARDMGLMWVPHEVIHLKDLGLNDWPRTALGKLSKLLLRKAVHQRYHDNLEKARNSMAAKPEQKGHEHWSAHVLTTWARALGIENESLALHTPVSEFADSLTIARVRGQIRREIPGQERLSARDMAENDTVAKQIDLVLQMLDGNGDVTDESGMGDSMKGPPEIQDMVHLTTQPDKFESTKQLILESISKDGFEWNDVQDVFPAQGFVSELSRKGVLDSAKFQNAFTTGTNDPKVLRSAIERMLRHNCILASYLVWDQKAEHGLDSDLALHVTLKHNEKLFDHVFQHGGIVESTDELRDLAANHPHPEWTLLPGMLFRVLIYNIKQTGTLGFIYSVSHCIMDATYQARFLGDLNEALDTSSTRSLRPHASYQLWAESYYSLQTTPQARKSIAWHAEYLHGIQDHLQEAQWPKTPLVRGRFDPTGKDYVPGVRHSFVVPDLAALRKQHPNISAPIIVKAALALLNIRRTGTGSAIFSNVQAGRTAWPFLPTSFSQDPAFNSLDEATDVAGPLLQSVTNFIKFSPEETVLDLLRRLQADQADLTQHAHAPWSEIEKALDRRASSSVSPHSGLMRKVFTTQIFNWIPGMGAQVAGTREPFEHFKSLASVTRWQVGVIVRAGLGGVDNDTVYLALLGDGLDASQMQDMVEELEANVRWITSPGNREACVEGI